MARKDIAMTPAEIQEFLSVPRTMQVVTVGGDGHPHAAPMWYVLLDSGIWFRSFTKSQKIVNLIRDSRVTVLVEEGKAYSDLRGVMIRGRAELVTDHATVVGLYGHLAARYPMVDDEPMPGMSEDEVEAAFGRFADKNTAVNVIPERITSWDHRKIGGGY